MNSTTTHIASPLDRVASVARYPFTGQGARATLYTLTGIATGTAAFAVWVTEVTVVAALAVLVIGAPVALAAALGNRRLAAAERARAKTVLGTPITAVYRQPAEPGLIARIRTTMTDPQTYRDVAYLVQHSVVGFTASIVAVTLWSVALAAVTLPLWFWALPESSMEYGSFAIDSFSDTLMASGVGVLLVYLAAWFCHAAAMGQARVARSLLGPSRKAAAVERTTQAL